jgi:hypothetical protein
MPTGTEPEIRFKAFSDAELLTELRDLHDAILSRVFDHGFYGLDPDYHDKPPVLERLDVGLAFGAKAVGLTERFVSGPAQADDVSVSEAEWLSGLDELLRELRLKAAAVTVGFDPRDGGSLKKEGSDG